MVEGWVVVVSRSGRLDLMTVRGYRHPSGELVVSPYMSFSRRLKSYDFREVEEFVRFVDCIGRHAPVIAESLVVTYIDPERALKVRRADLDPRVLELLDTLAPEWAGLTGSWAVFSEKPGSDVDLLVYGDSSKLYRALQDLRDEGLIRSCRLEDRLEKTRDLSGPKLSALLAGRRLLDSCYKEHPYTIRVLERLDREPCSERVYYWGRYEGLVKIEEVLGAPAVPTRYRAVLLDIGVEAVLETWHTRFAELPRGVYTARLVLLEERGVVKASPDVDGWIEVEQVGDRGS
ncbi:MAG: hypothetical protein QXK97_01365 [Acidilobaceae archaeon]